MRYNCYEYNPSGMLYASKYIAVTFIKQKTRKVQKNR